ncbi:aryl-alcohol dehydrogenase [Mycena latifolia]|nr:aryl-alcohol dehydrogenase [Mycena latifolia]
MSSATQTMEYVRLGKSGLKISKIVLGCMSYGNPNWWATGSSRKRSLPSTSRLRMMPVFNAFDTANVYSKGLSEEVLGRAIKEHKLPRDEIVVLTKVFFALSHNPEETLFGVSDFDAAGSVNQYGLSRKHIFDTVCAVCNSTTLMFCNNLGHRFDPNTPIEATMQALHDVVKAGYVRYIGMSSCYAWQFHAMQNYAIANKLTPFISMQNHYNMLYREEEREMMPTLKHFGVGAIPWSPLARGALTRPLDQQTKRGASDGMPPSVYTGSAASETIVNRVEEVAKKRGISMAQVSVVSSTWSHRAYW